VCVLKPSCIAFVIADSLVSFGKNLVSLTTNSSLPIVPKNGSKPVPKAPVEPSFSYGGYGDIAIRRVSTLKLCPSLGYVCINIQNSADLIEKCFQQDGVVAALERLVCWNINNHQCHILNVDGSCLGSPIRAGYGGLLRNNSRSFLSGFSSYLPTSNCILLAELTAICKGLKLALDMGLEDLVCNTDSQLSVNLIKGDTSKYHAYVVLVQDIKDAMGSRNFIIQHILREGNQCADFIAKLGASSNSKFVLHPTAPQDLLSLLATDAMGTQFPRA